MQGEHNEKVCNCPLSALAGRDAAALQQQQTIKSLQAERAKANELTPDQQKMLEDCKKLMSQPKQS